MNTLEDYIWDKILLDDTKLAARICRRLFKSYLKQKRAFDDKYGRLDPKRLP
jgi:hypothetical protein